MSGRFLGLENRTAAHGPDPLPWLRVSPPAVTFADVEANTAYTATVTLRNADSRPHVVKVIPPKTSRFALAGERGVTTTRLSPGLTASFDVTFATDEVDDFFDACVIQTDAGETDVRLAARAPAPRISVEGDFDFGVAAPGDALTRTASVRNAGAAAARIECAWDKTADPEVFRVEPRFVTVEPGKAVEVTAFLNPEAPGDASVDVFFYVATRAGRARDADARRAEVARLFATATVVPRAPEFLTDAPDAEPTPMRAVDFGHVLCGDARAVSGAVYNNSPYPATFAVKLRAEDKADKASRRDLSSLAVSPSKGALRPYEKRRVTFTMRPARPEASSEAASGSAKGFRSTARGAGEAGATREGHFKTATASRARDVRLCAIVAFDASAKVKPLRLPVHARAVDAALAVDPPELDFGEIAARDRGDHLVTVRNLNDEMPVDFAFARGVFFKPEPSFGRVLPGQTVNVAVSYEPKGLGAHAAALAVRALGVADAGEESRDGAPRGGGGEKVTVFETSVMCRGSCRDARSQTGNSGNAMPGGLTATPADFEKARKYVNPTDVASQKETRRRERAETLARVGRSGTHPGTKGGALVDPETAARYARARDVDETSDAFTLDEAVRRAAHREGYAEYLRSSRMRRIRAADPTADDPADPTSLGLRNQYDLKKPEAASLDGGKPPGSRTGGDHGPALPRADEPLWIDPDVAAAADGGASSKARRGVRGGAKIPFSYLRPRNRPQQAVEAETSTSGGGPRTQHASEPATAAQRRECARVLIPAEVAKLSAGPSRLDFGSVAGGSTHVKYFAFTNGTAQAVSARLELRRGTSVASEATTATVATTATTRVSTVSEPAPSEPSNESGVVSLRGGAAAETRVVPPGDTAHFAIELEALNGDEHRVAFKETVAYVVNDNPGNVFSFDVAAEIVPAALDLDCHTKRFAFEKNDDASFSVVETVRVSNPNGDPARFRWDVPPGCAFDVQPRVGEVPGRGAVHVAVTWTPSEARRENERTLEMYVAGDATPRALRCVGECGAPALAFAEKLLQFGCVPAGLPARRVVTLRNASAHDAVFAVDDRHESRLEDVSTIAATRVTAEPTRGRVPAGGLFDVDVLYVNPSRGKHRSHLVLHVRGGKTVRLPVSIDAIVPDVRVVERALRFGDAFVSSPATAAATLRNDSPVPATLCLDARSTPELSVSCPTDSWSPEVYDDPPVLQMPRSEQNVLGLMGNRIVNALVARGSAVAAARRGWGEDKGGNRFKIRVAPNSELRVFLSYTPKEAHEKRAFFLPLYQEGVPVEDLVPDLTRVDLSECESVASLLAVPATARAVEPRVRLSAASLAFGAKVATREGARRTEHVLSFTIAHNETEDAPIRWALGTPTADRTSAAAFSFAPASGTVRRGEKVEIACAFAPRDATTHRASVPVFLDEPELAPVSSEGAPHSTRTPYLTLDVSGEGVRPRLDFDTREITLAPTPLGVPTTRRFSLVNRGYANERVSHRLPSDTNKIDLRVEYPEGTQIGVAQPTLPVDVTFVSSTPMSFTAAIDFLDEEGNRFCAPVSGVADNSALTLENFVDVNNANGAFDDRLVVALPALEAPACKTVSMALASVKGTSARARARGKETLPADLAPVVLRDAAGLATPSPAQAELAGADCTALALWLEASTPRGPFSREDLPSSLRARGGRVFVDLVEFWSGRTFLGKTLNASADPRARALQTLRQYEALLTHLKSCGATLAGVRPELLIDGDDFRRLARSYARQIEHGEVTHVEADRMRLWIELDVDPPGRARRGRLAAAAWRQTLMQAIKVFVLARVAPRKKPHASGNAPDVTASRGATPGPRGTRARPSDDRTVVDSSDSGPSETRSPSFDPRDPAGLTGSNAFNASEQILLRWLTKHRRSVFGADAPRVRNFGADLKDASVFYAAIAAHWPSLRQTHGARMAFPTNDAAAAADVSRRPSDQKGTDAAAESNARVVLDALASVRQKYADVADARVVITDASPSDRVLFALFLYETLPTLIPRAVVSFACRLGATTKRDVVLTNPADVAVAYRARLVGPASATEQFALEQSFVRLGPKQEVTLRVLCSPTIAKAEEERDPPEPSAPSPATRAPEGGGSTSASKKSGPTARCFLVLSSARESLRASGAAASTLVFALEASVDADLPVSSETFAARCYEMTTAAVAVTNPFPADCDFSVTCVNLRRDDPRAAEAFAAMDEENDKENVSRRRKSSTSTSVSRGGTTSHAKASVREIRIDANAAARALPRMRRSKYPGAFGAARAAARARGGAAFTVDVAFLPFAMGAHVAHLVFEDADHGRFAVELLGVADLPPPAATVRADVEVRPQTFDVAVDHANPPFERARRLFLEKHPGRLNRAEAMKARAAGTDAWPSAIEYAALSDSAFVDVDETVRVARSARWNEGAGPASGSREDDVTINATGDGAAPMRLGLTLRDAGTYPATLVLGSAHDVRVLKFEFAAGLRDDRATLEFSCVARGVVSQEIPLVNGGDKSMVVRGALSGPDAAAFAGAGRDVVVPKGRRDAFPLAFKPSKQGAFRAALTLRTTGPSGESGESVSYALKGFAAPPEAESTIVIHAVARETVFKTIAVPNVFGPGAAKAAAYAVECDLDFVGGEPTCVAPRDGDAHYEMTFAPRKSGAFRGAVHFIAAGGHALWFALEVRVARAKPEISVVGGTDQHTSALPDDDDGHDRRTTSLFLRAPARVAAKARLTLANPLDAPAVFRARTEGHGLMGAPTLTLPANGSGSYEVTYSPLIAGTAKGSVSFTHDTLGEFWYPATLVAEEAPAEEAPPAAAPLGGAPALVKLRLRNPTDEPIELAVDVTDEDGAIVDSKNENRDGRPTENVFSVVSPSTRVLTLAPFEKGRIAVAFAPSVLDETRVATVTASSATAGTWRFRVSGVGTAPSEPNPPTVLFVTLGQSGSHAVTFVNPFEHAVSIAASLEETNETKAKNRFELLRSGAAVVAARASHAFPFRFTPSSMRRAEATLVITSKARAGTSARVPSLTWRFPIVGEAEAPMSGREYRVRGKVRRRTETGLAVSLRGLEVRDSDVVSDAEGAGVPFAFEIAAPTGEREHLKQALCVTPLQARVAEADAPLRFHVATRPRREISCVVDLLVTVSSGGRWRFPIRVDAEEPEVDGVIRVKAHVGAPSVSAFSLPNPDTEATTFAAFFTPDSPAAFSVAPETGTMAAGAPIDPSRAASASTGASPGSRGLAAARGRFEVTGEAAGDGPGAEFRIGYAPTEYGTDLVGRLRVVTDLNAWTFEVVGATPDYVKPSAPARVDAKIGRDTELLLEKAKRRNREVGNIVLKNTKPENYTSRRMLSRS